jgi:hypothetical protein
LSALLVTEDGQFVPCSQEIRHVATRHVSTDILFDPRIPEHPDFSWEDALEAVGKAGAQNFFQRTRRIGLRRPWDAQASADTLPLASPLTVLSSAVALADPSAGRMIPAAAFALLDALLDPIFAFLTERRLAFAAVEPIVIVATPSGRGARLVLQKLFRRRGFPPLMIVRREIAAALALIDDVPCQAVVIDASEDDLHLHRVAIDGDSGTRRFCNTASATIRGHGWSHWSARIALALRTTPSAGFSRALTTLLTGSPDSLESRLTRGALESALDDAWIARERDQFQDRLQEALATIGAGSLRRLFAGEIFAADAVVRLFGGIPALGVPLLDQSVRSVAVAMAWLTGETSRRLVLAASGSLRVDSRRGDSIELMPLTRIPEPGESCHFDAGFRFGGEGVERSFLLSLLWGSDRAPAGNATLCTAPLELPGGQQELRLTVHLRRSRSGSRLSGTVDARVAGDAVAARMRFTEELEVTR